MSLTAYVICASKSHAHYMPLIDTSSIWKGRPTKWSGNSPCLQKSVELSDCRICNQPPDYETICVERVQWRYPETEFEEEGIDLNCQHQDYQGQHLDEPERTLQWVPLVLVPVGWSELPQRSPNLWILASPRLIQHALLLCLIKIATEIYDSCSNC